MNKKDQVILKCISLFGKPDYILRAPGRANIIGEHVDYCNGYVLPFSIEQSMYFAAVNHGKSKGSIYALDLDEYLELDNNTTAKRGWHKYFISLRNVMRANDINISGIDLVFGSNIPIGGGVSSSSALCCGLLTVINRAKSLGLSKREIVNLASEIEHGVGLKGGKMDQTAIVYGQKNKAILLDCKDQTHKVIELDLQDNTFVLFDTKVKHALVESEYNKRRVESEEALSLVQKQCLREDIDYRNITVKQVEFIKQIDPVGYKRLKHIRSEMARVLKTLDAIERKNFDEIGDLLWQSHVSLMDDYNVSCSALDFIVNSLKNYSQVLGARMMGGGFGGNVIALMNKPLNDNQWTEISNNYKKEFGLVMNRMPIKPSNGIVFL